MKKQILEISRKLEACYIDDKEAQQLLLDLFLVSKSFYSDDAIARLKTEYFEKGLKANK